MRVMTLKHIILWLAMSASTQRGPIPQQQWVNTKGATVAQDIPKIDTTDSWLFIAPLHELMKVPNASMTVTFRFGKGRKHGRLWR